MTPLLVYAQNGEMLRPEQGYPLRLFLPGFEGNMNVKWLRRLKLGDAPFMTREETSKYTDLMPDGTARQFTFVMEAKSVIVRPSGGQTLRRARIRRDLRLRLERARSHPTGRRVRGRRPELARGAVAGAGPAEVPDRLSTSRGGGMERRAVLQSRAVDDTGYVQPARSALLAARGIDSYYHYNAIQSWRIGADGGVENVHA